MRIELQWTFFVLGFPMSPAIYYNTALCTVLIVPHAL